MGQAACLPFLLGYTTAMAGELEIRRRRLPHWTLAGSPSFLTWRLAKGIAPLSAAERDMIEENLLHFKDPRVVGKSRREEDGDSDEAFMTGDSEGAFKGSLRIP